MDPLSQFLMQLLGQPIGPGSIVPNLQPGSGVPSTSSINSALPGLSYSPFANPGSPYAAGGSPSVGSPTGTATPGSTGSSGLGADPFLAGSIFNQIFPSSVNQATPSAGLGGGNINMAAEPTGAAGLLNMATPTGGEVQPTGGGGDPSVGAADPGASGQASPDGGSVAAANASNVMSGVNQGLLGFLGNSFGVNPTLSFANGNFGLSNTSGVPGGTLSLSNLAGLLGTMFGGPMFSMANSALGGLATGLQGLNTQSGNFSGPLGNFFGNSTPSAAPNQSLADINRGSLPNPNFSGRGIDAAPGAGGIGGPGPAAGAPGAAPSGIGPGTASDPSGGQPGVAAPGIPGVGTVGIVGTDPTTSDVSPATAATANSPPGDAPGDGPGDGGSLLCTYCLGNGSYDAKTADGHRKVFGGLAGRALKDPALKESFGHYQQASRQILDKIDTLDQGRRKSQLTDLHENLVKPFHAAAMRKDVKGAARILRDQTVRLAQTHGITIPPEHLAAANKALGGANEPNDQA